MYYYKHMNANKGFTLIELLIVIAIISLLTSIILPNLVQGRGKARNAVRMSDIKNIDMALKRYIIDNGKTPFADDPNFSGNTPLYVIDRQAQWAVLSTKLDPYLKLPKDPCGQACDKTTAGQYYTYHYEYGKALCDYLDQNSIKHGPCPETYRIYAENLEGKSGNSSFGFGEGSF